MKATYLSELTKPYLADENGRRQLGEALDEVKAAMLTGQPLSLAMAARSAPLEVYVDADGGHRVRDFGLVRDDRPEDVTAADIEFHDGLLQAGVSPELIRDYLRHCKGASLQTMAPWAHAGIPAAEAGFFRAAGLDPELVAAAGGLAGLTAGLEGAGGQSLEPLKQALEQQLRGIATG